MAAKADPASSASIDLTDSGYLQRPYQETSRPKNSPVHSSKTYLQEWIDGNTAHCTVSNDIETGLAETFSHTCVLVFQGLWKSLRQSLGVIQSKEKLALKTSLERLVLWTDSFPSGQLDLALGRSKKLQENIMDLFTDIAKTLNIKLVPIISQKLSPGDGSHQSKQLPRGLDRHARELSRMIEKAGSSGIYGDSESDESGSDDCSLLDDTAIHVRRLSSLTKGLMDLLPSLQKAMNVSHETLTKSRFRSTIICRVSDPAYSFVSQIIDKFPSINITLAGRLGQANWERHQRIRKSHEPSNDSSTAEELEGNPESGDRSLFQPHSLFHDSGIGSSKPEFSAYAMSQASHKSFLSDIEDRDPRTLKVPETPAQVAHGQPFQCDICGHTLSKIRNRIDWKIHVFADLQPYICTWPECREVLTTFPTRRLWGEHEFSCHRVETLWKCSHCDTELVSSELFKTHLHEVHAHSPTPSYLDILAKAAKVCRPSISKDTTCPLCASIVGSSRKAFETHIGRHMEEIVLISLPKEDHEGSEVESTSIGERMTILTSDGLQDGQLSEHLDWNQFDEVFEGHDDPEKEELNIHDHPMVLLKGGLVINDESLPSPRCRACVSCSQLKARCDGRDPSCGSCARLGLNCIYPRQGEWTLEEDRALLALTDVKEAQNWFEISDQMKYRTSRQCRERYQRLNHISPEEGTIIEKLVKEKGEQGFEIAEALGKRPENVVKKWWTSRQNRAKSSTVDVEEKRGEGKWNRLVENAAALEEMPKCKVCHETATDEVSIDCASCRNTSHISCTDPPLLKKPPHGVAWLCSTCHRVFEEQFEPSPLLEEKPSGLSGDDAAERKRVVDVERQCGVIIPNGEQCDRSLTCNLHSIEAKCSVPGRSSAYDNLLQNYQMIDQATKQRAKSPAFNNRSSGPRRIRGSWACEPCRQRKTKCNGDQPICKRCANFRIQCYYADNERDRAKSTADSRKASEELKVNSKSEEKEMTSSSKPLLIYSEPGALNPPPVPQTSDSNSKHDKSDFNPTAVRRQFMPHPREEIGVIDAPFPPSPENPVPVPPLSLTLELARLGRKYPNDSFEVTMRYTPIDTLPNLPLSAAVVQTVGIDKIKYKYVPRIRCYDCPGKLYTADPGMGIENFEVHLKNARHREKVETRILREGVDEVLA